MVNMRLNLASQWTYFEPAPVSACFANQSQLSASNRDSLLGFSVGEAQPHNRRQRETADSSSDYRTAEAKPSANQNSRCSQNRSEQGENSGTEEKIFGTRIRAGKQTRIFDPTRSNGSSR